MPYATSSGVKIYFESYGAGLPIVFLAPLAANGYIWYHQLFSFALTHRCIVIDARGHARSDKPDGGYNIPQMAKDVIAVLDELAVPKAVLVGNSIGGMIAMQLNLDHPERVIGNLLAGTTTNMGGSMPKEMIEAFMRDSFNMFCAMMDAAVSPHTRRERPEIAATMKAQLTGEATFPRRVFNAIVADPNGPFAWNITARLGEIKAPTLVVVGADDQATPVVAARLLSDHIPGAHLEVIPDAGHFSQIENPLRFNQLLQQLVDPLAAHHAHG